MEERIYHSSNRPGEYLKYWYHGNSEGDKLPLLIYIHGAGGRGDDPVIIKDNAAYNAIARGDVPPCIHVAPQCHADTWFELFDVLLEFIDYCRTQPEIDQDRVYIGGSSMGGYTTWQVCMTKPDWFAAAVPVCGGGMYWNAGRLVNLPIWAFHGALDGTVLPEESIHMVAAINNCGGHAKLTILPETRHDAWVPAFTSLETWEWMFAQKR